MIESPTPDQPAAEPKPQGELPKYSILTSQKLMLSTPHPSAQGTRCFFGADVYRENPRWVVATNDPGLKDPEHRYGKIEAALSGLDFFAVLQIFEEIIDSPNATRYMIETNKAENNSREVKHDATIIIGKDDRGIVFVSVVKPNDSRWPVVKFQFMSGDPRFTVIKTSDGKVLDASIISVKYAKGWIEMIKGLLPQEMIRSYTTTPMRPRPEFKKSGGNFQRGNGGGYQQRQGGGGYQNRNGGGYNKGGYQPRQGGGGYNGGNGGNGGGGYQNRNNYQQNDKRGNEDAKPAEDFADDGLPF